MKAIVLIIIFSLLVGYISVALYTNDWKIYQWNGDQSEAGKFIGGTVLVILFIIFRKQVDKIWPDKKE
ncbi:hypothetical protein GCM10027592_17220 [Spirosoma flavus]